MPATALLRLSPSPRLVIECTDGLSTENIQLDVSRSPVTVSLFNTKIESFIVGRTVRVGEGSRISLTLLPKREPVTVHRTEERSSSVELSVLNFPEFFGGQDKRVQVGNEWRVLGSALLRVEGWEIEVSAVTTLHEIEKKLKAEGGYAITHTGTVKRLDGGDFAAQDVEPSSLSASIVPVLCSRRLLRTDSCGWQGRQGTASLGTVGNSQGDGVVRSTCLVVRQHERLYPCRCVSWFLEAVPRARVLRTHCCGAVPEC